VRSPSRTDTAHSWLHTVARNHPQQQVTQENRHPESRNFGLGDRHPLAGRHAGGDVRDGKAGVALLTDHAA